jgi:signal transduction histidine kinase
MRSPTPRSSETGFGLRSTITVAVILIAGLAVAAGLFLIGLTSLLRRSGEERAVELRSLRLVEAAEVDLLLHTRAEDRAVRAAHESEILRRLDEASEYVTSDLEGEVLARARADVESYLQPFRGSRASDDVDGALAAAFSSLEALLELNAAQSRVAAARAASADRLANVVGITAVAGVAALVGILVWWLWRRALSPILELDAVMKKFGTGDRDVRAQVDGAAELVGVARRFNEMADELTRQREAQMTFLAGVAHDLRNPLGPLKAAAAVLAQEDRQGTRPNAALLRVLERQVDHLDRLIGDLLETARIEAGEHDLRIEEVDARFLAEEAVELFRPAAANIAFHLSTPPGPVLLSCDPTRVQQVLNNLISNAIKYSGDGGQVAVTVRRERSGVSFSVQDRGVGISEQDQERLFEPFRRTERAEHSLVRGEGLGLFVARRIVEAHAGSLEVRSTEGQGSTFRVDLPQRPPAKAQAQSTIA